MTHVITDKCGKLFLSKKNNKNEGWLFNYER